MCVLPYYTQSGSVPDTRAERRVTDDRPYTFFEQDTRRGDVGTAQSFGKEDGLGLDVGMYSSHSPRCSCLPTMRDHSSRRLSGVL